MHIFADVGIGVAQLWQARMVQSVPSGFVRLLEATMLLVPEPFKDIVIVVKYHGELYFVLPVFNIYDLK